MQNCGVAEPVNHFDCHAVMDAMDSNPEKLEAANSEHYGPEVLCASWNPLVTALAEPVEAARKLTTEAKSAEGESFLARFYRSQQS
jgi:hypothetical protein